MNLRTLLTRWLRVYLVLAAIFVVFAVVQADPEDVVPVVAAASFSLWYLVAYFGGGFLHWLSKYSAGTTDVNFGTYLWKNMQWTIVSQFVGLGVFAAAVNAAPAAYADLTFGTFVATLLLGMGADTVNSNGSAAFPSRPAPAAPPGPRQYPGDERQ